VWLVGCGAALGVPALVFGAPALVPDAVDCAVTCPVVGCWPEGWAFDAAPAVPGEPVVLAVSEPSSALTLPAV
jgi:hypothetical protein